VSEQEIVAIDRPARPSATTTAEDITRGDSPGAAAEESVAPGDKPQPSTSPAKAISVKDLVPGTRFVGKVKSVAEFGAFVDIGVGQDGLVHISELRRGRVEKVSDVVKEGDEVAVWVKDIDTKRRRIGLTMIEPARIDINALEPGMVIEGRVTRLEPYGAFVDIGTGRDGLVHISEISQGYIGSPAEILSVGEEVEVRILKVNRKKGQVDLSIKDVPAKQIKEEEEPEPLPTIMALAFQEALAEREGEGAKAPRRKEKRPRRGQAALDALIARTLRSRQQ
jgi:small subunit ribosomal protein S1